MNKVRADHAGMPSLLIVDDDPVVVELVGLYAREAGFGSVVGAGTADEGLRAFRNGQFRLVFLDLGLPDRPDGDALREFMVAAGSIPVVVVTADGRVETAVRCMKSGAFDYLDKPLSPARIMSLLAHAKENIRLKALLEPMNPALRSPVFSRIVTASPLMLGLFQTIERLGSSPLPVLVYGESGTGKELVAQAIHDVSGRLGPFVPVNVAGLDGALFSDVLFGHARGAYTGAESARPGLVKRAEGGTLFMDEIGDIGPESQVKLLRFLQDGEYYPLGSDKPERSACRVVLATHVNLAEAVKAGRFRADLYYRLMIHIVTIPPLRDRKEDIPILVDYFARQAADYLKLPAPPTDPAFIAALEGYNFPGNVRELSAVVYGASTASGTGRPSISYAKEYIARQKVGQPAEPKEACVEYPYLVNGSFLPLEHLELLHIREALRRSGGNQSAAANLLGISQSTISRRLKQLSEEST